MSLTFGIAPTISAGDSLKASDMIKLVNAFNDRERCGLADISWRRLWWAYNAFRQVRLPDELGNTPLEGEFWYIYHHLDPAAVSSNDLPRWPVAGPGDPEGANLNSIFNAYVFGSEYDYNEETRLGGVDLWGGNAPPTTAEGWWELAKAQRGVIDPDTGEQNCPAIETSHSNRISVGSGNYRNFHGKAWGGMFPTPAVLLPDCGDGFPSLEIFFTAKSADVSTTGKHGTISTNGDGLPVVTYAGTCYGVENHIQDFYNAGKYWVVAILSGGVLVYDDFNHTDWKIGPFSGNGQLYRHDGGHISRALWAFTNDFRGTAGQRSPDTFNIQDIAFDFQAFHQNQYLLAPNIGVPAGDGIAALYPTAIISGNQISGGTFLEFEAGGTEHEYREGYRLTGFFAKGTLLRSNVTVEVLADGVVVGALSLTPDAPSALKYLSEPKEPFLLKVRIANDAKFNGIGMIEFQATEQFPYEPDHWDAAMLTRLMSTEGGFEGEGDTVDGSGLNYESAKELYENYLAYGCVYNPRAAGVRTLTSSVNENPVFDAARRLTRMARIVPRQQLLSYSVSGGVATLRFKRYPYGLSNVKADAFEGIAPSWRAVAELIEGETYVVRSHAGGSINYRGRTITHNRTFTASAEDLTFITNGDAEVLEYEGIKPNARKKGWSNEWLMFIGFHVHHPSNSSNWRLETYSDHYVFNNRSMFYADGPSSDMPTDLHNMTTIGGANIRANHFSCEAPSAYNYFGSGSGTLNASATSDFQKSCPLFPKPYELASATVEFVESGDDIVKLVFKTAFQSHPDAPATVDADPSTYNITDLDAEDYRTDDNGLRQYFAMDALGHYSPVKVGDCAYEAMFDLTSLPDNPFACCIPKFFFSKLISKPYADGNNTIQSHDSRVVIDQFREMECWLRCACEGFVDGLTTQAQMCGVGGSPYDYTFENLCFEAFNETHIGDFGSGHGPQVNTELLASLFNKFSAAVNLLDKVAIHGIMKIQTREANGFGFTDVTADLGTTSNCPITAGNQTIWSGQPPSATLGAWVECDPINDPGEVWCDFTSGFAAGFDSLSAALNYCGPNSTLAIESAVNVREMRVVTNGFDDALSADLLELLTLGNTVVYGELREYDKIPWMLQVAPGDADYCDGASGAFSFAGSGYQFGHDYPRGGEGIETVTACATADMARKNLNPHGGDFGLCAAVIGGLTTQVVKSSSTSYSKFIPYNLTALNSAIIKVPLVEQTVEG